MIEIKGTELYQCLVLSTCVSRMNSTKLITLNAKDMLFTVAMSYQRLPNTRNITIIDTFSIYNFVIINQYDILFGDKSPNWQNSS